MSDEGCLAGRLQRLREVGLAGVARRIGDRARRGSVLRAQAQWRATYVDAEASDAALLCALLPIGNSGDGRDPFVVARDALGAGGTRFFLAADDAKLRDAFATRHAAARARIVCEADAALAGDLSWVVPGGGIDWHAALPAGGRWPATELADVIAIGAARPLGDVRLSWEIGRCTHLVRLAQAAWLTGDVAYARAVAAGVLDFARANPPGRGVAWAHAQEAAIRAVALLHAFFLTRAFGVFDAPAFRVWLGAILAHGDYVAAHLADHPITHNHLVSEAAGLAILGMALPELRAAAGWRRTGLRLLWRELWKLVDDEGVEAEYSTHYHAFVLDSLIAVLALADRCGEPVDARVRARVAAMVELPALLLRDDGTLPAIGDTDAGRAWRLGGDPLDRRDLLAAAAVVFDRGDWGAIAGDAPGTFWITGGRAVPGAGLAPPPGRARRFEAAGIAVARSGFGADAEIAVFRAGPTRHRADVARGHLHADALSVLWRSGADDVLIDPGTYLYSEHDGWRGWLRGSAAHSCVVIDGRDQADVRTHRFGISGERPSRWLAFSGDTTQLLAAAEHPAHASICVRRRMAWCAGGLLVLCDDVAGDDVHRVDWWYQLPAATGDATANAAQLTLASGRSLAVQLFGDAERLEVLRPDGAPAPGPGWHAPRYGVLRAGVALRATVEKRALPLRVVTVFQLDAASPAVAEARPGGGMRLRCARAAVDVAGDGSLRIERAA